MRRCNVDYALPHPEANRFRIRSSIRGDRPSDLRSLGRGPRRLEHARAVSRSKRSILELELFTRLLFSPKAILIGDFASNRATALNAEIRGV
jgi:hypothetical protein